MELLGDIVQKGARLYGNKEAVLFEGTRLTYSELNQRVNKLANYLLSISLPDAKHVAILAENCYQYLEVYFAAAKSGHVVTPLNFRLAPVELVEIVKDAESKLLFYGRGYENIAREIAEQAGINYLISIEDRPEAGSDYCEDLISSFPGSEPEVEVGENQMAILMYTGGTTGKAKGVMLSHRNLMHAAICLSLQYKFTDKDSTCFLLPLFHISLWPALLLLIAGGKVVILRRPEITNILETIHTEKCTHINAVPTIYNWMMQHPDLDKYDLSSLSLISYAGSPIAPELLKRMIAKFGNILMQGYGLTEAAPAVTGLLPEDHVPEGPPEIARRLKSVGKEAPLVTVKVLAEDGMEVKPGQVGEITAKGKNIMMGYWKNPRQTAEALKNGWLHTGDMATVDEDGYIYLVDRKKDMIITGGENVYPREVEDVLYEHHAVLEVAVIGVPDGKWGEAVKAVVVLREGMKADENEIIQFAKSRLAGYKCPKSVDFTEALPKTSVGKITRAELKKQYWQGSDRFIG